MLLAELSGKAWDWRLQCEVFRLLMMMFFGLGRIRGRGETSFVILDDLEGVIFIRQLHAI